MKEGRQTLASLNSLPSLASGKVFLIGAGPGAIDLITVRGMRLLQQADIVFYDALVDTALLDYCPAKSLRIHVGKRCGQHSTAQNFIHKRLIDAAHKYKTVVRLKGGDPMIFARADEEIKALQKSCIEVEIVPGITAALAAAAQLKQPLTQREHAKSVAFWTPSSASLTQEASPLPQADTLVVYMAKNQTHQVAKQWLAAHRPAQTPVCIIESISTPQERSLTMTITEMANGQADAWLSEGSPALIIIGTVLRDRVQNGHAIANRRLTA